MDLNGNECKQVRFSRKRSVPLGQSVGNSGQHSICWSLFYGGPKVELGRQTHFKKSESNIRLFGAAVQGVLENTHYLSFVRPILEHALAVGDPHTRLLTEKKNQNSCTRFALTRYTKGTPLSSGEKNLVQKSFYSICHGHLVIDRIISTLHAFCMGQEK